MSLINCMEKIVDEAIEEFIDKNPKWDDVINRNEWVDIKIYTLNNLPPLYSTSLKGYLFNKSKNFNIQSQINIVKLITQGIELMMEERKSGV